MGAGAWRKIDVASCAIEIQLTTLWGCSWYYGQDIPEENSSLQISSQTISIMPRY